MTTLPTLFVFTGADQVTGALISNFGQARILHRDLDMSLILSMDARLNPEQLPENGSLKFFPLARADKRLRSLLTYPAALLRSGWHLHTALKQAGCDRLQVNDFHIAEGAIVRLLGFRGRIVTWIRIDPKRYGIIGQIWLVLARWSSDELVVVSKFIASRLPTGYRTTLIYDAVPPVDDVPRATNQKFLFIGNYIEGKGQNSAILAFHRIAARFPEAQLVFHGSDMGLPKNRNYRAHLAQIAESGEGKGRIDLRDFVQNTSAAYGQAYAALNFSHSESFSLTCLEASVHGLPVVATRCGGPEEIIDDGETGYLVPVGDIDAMAGRMAELLDDPNKAARMGEAGRRLVNKRFGTAQFRRQILEIFDLH